MITGYNINEWAERFLEHRLSGEEQARLEEALDKNPELHRQWLQTIEILKTFQSGAERNDIRNLIRSVAAEQATVAQPAARVIPFGKYLRTTAAAAGLILCSSLATLFFAGKKDNKADQKKYIELVRAIDHIKDSQNKIIDSLNKSKGMEAEPAESSSEAEVAAYGGTGFAISNEGYLATNYHVVKNAGKIMVQTPRGDKAAYIVAQDINSDIAILKLEDRSFRFGKGALPYNISRPVSGLGQRVFTIGYPRDEVVYNEGYISCENGYEGDRQSYQLEMTANPGQSGSPVMDKYGSVIALITGKQSNTSGTTFAVHSGALVDLVQSLPRSAAIRLPDNNRLTRLERTEQVRKMRDYVFPIKVN